MGVFKGRDETQFPDGSTAQKVLMVDASGAVATAATAANQVAASASLATIAGKDFATAGNQAAGNASLATIATSIAGVATAVNQTMANTSLAGIKTDMDNLNGAGLNFANVALCQSVAGITVLQAAATGKVARLHGLAITVDTDATVVQIVQDDDGAGTNSVVLATWKLNSYGGIVLPIERTANPWAQAAPGKALTLVTTTGKAFGIAKVSQQ